MDPLLSVLIVGTKRLIVLKIFSSALIIPVGEVVLIPEAHTIQSYLKVTEG